MRRLVFCLRLPAYRTSPAEKGERGFPCRAHAFVILSQAVLEFEEGMIDGAEACSVPRRVIQFAVFRAKRPMRFGWQYEQRNGQVECWIAVVNVPPVDDSGNLRTVYDEVPRIKIAVEHLPLRLGDGAWRMLRHPCRKAREPHFAVRIEKRFAGAHHRQPLLEIETPELVPRQTSFC